MFNIDIPAASEQSPCPISMSLHVPEEQRQDGMFAPITLSPQQPVPPPAYCQFRGSAPRYGEHITFIQQLPFH